MTDASDGLAELRSLLEALCEETITPDQMARLEELLVADRRATAFYIESMHVQAGFLREFGGGQPGLGAPGHAQREETPAPAIDAGRVRSGRRHLALRYWRWWAGAAALAFFLAWWLNARPVSQDRRGVPIAAGPPRRVMPGAVAPGDGFAMLVQLVRVEWEPGDGRRPAEGEIVPACRLALRSGRVTLAFLSGVTLTVEGPAEVDLVAIDRVFCHRGRLRARVPEGAEGFVVSSPGSAVVDLGTEFALNVEPSGRARVMVFEGVAEAALLDAAGSPERTERVEQKKAFEIDPQRGRIVEAVARVESFVTRPELVPPALVFDDAYSTAVRKSSPWSYWRFESMTDGTVPNEVSGRPSLRATGPVRISDSRADNHAAVFKAGEAACFLALDGRWEPARDPGFAIELWFVPEILSHASLVSLFTWGESGPERAPRIQHFCLAELEARTRRALNLPCAVRFLHRWPPGGSGGDNLYSRTHYVAYRWHHLVAQRRGDRLEMFLDGAQTASGPVALDPSSVPCQLLLGRWSPAPGDPARDRASPDSPWSESRPFVGQMDEVALYDHPLTADEIRGHYQLATQRAPSP